MKDKILKLSSENWREHATEIIEIMKPEIFESMGGQVIPMMRSEYEERRQKKLEKLRDDFLKNANISNMDEQVNAFTLGIYQANSEPQDNIKYSFLNYVYNHSRSLKKICPNCVAIADFVFKKSSINIGSKSREKLLQNYRIVSLVNTLVNKSVEQSGKSNAGNAGELFVSAILDAIGLKKDKHYKCQHKSSSGSDTDFVLPYVKDKQDHEIEVCCAVQFSSNDRLRMVNGELKSGTKFAITGNGLDASSKNCDAIGLEILNKAKQEHHQLVCYSKERERFIEEHQKKSQEKKKNGQPTKNATKSKEKLDFFQNNCKSFSEFAEEMEYKFSSRN